MTTTRYVVATWTVEGDAAAEEIRAELAASGTGVEVQVLRFDGGRLVDVQTEEPAEQNTPPEWQALVFRRIAAENRLLAAAERAYATLADHPPTLTATGLWLNRFAVAISEQLSVHGGPANLASPPPVTIEALEYRPNADDRITIRALDVSVVFPSEKVKP